MEIIPLSSAYLPKVFIFSVKIITAPNAVKRIIPIFVIGYTIIAGSFSNAPNKKKVENILGTPRVIPRKEVVFSNFIFFAKI